MYSDTAGQSWQRTIRQRSPPELIRDLIVAVFVDPQVRQGSMKR
jgi:hypothetical protein